MNTEIASGVVGQGLEAAVREDHRQIEHAHDADHLGEHGRVYRPGLTLAEVDDDARSTPERKQFDPASIAHGATTFERSVQRNRGQFGEYVDRSGR